MSGFSEADLDLEKLFLPAWAQEKPEKNRYEKFSPEEHAEPRRGRRAGGFPADRPDRERRRPEFGGKRRFRKGEGTGGERTQRREEAPAPLPEITAEFLPDDNGVEHIARQIKVSGRAYPLFQIAQLILQKPERYSVRLAVKKNAEGAIAQRLLSCALDETPWLSEEEAAGHVLKNHFPTFYRAERTPTEPPKGTYTFVAQCGMSGVILGPPNYHSYQNQLRKLHAERFSKMPFDVFKSRVKIVRDEAVVKKWIEEQSFKSEYICLNVPDALKLASMEEVEKHFRATHKDAIIKPVETITVDGVKSRNLGSRDLNRLVRAAWEKQRDFPLQVASVLSRQLSGHGLQTFKVNKTFIHVGVARPQFLDLETTPVSGNIRRIVEFIKEHPKCSRRKLFETLAPGPTMIEIKPGEQAATVPTAEQTALIADLHWLIHQGHVLEFADGRLETAKKPLSKPPKPETKPSEEAPPQTEQEAAAPEEAKPMEPPHKEPTEETQSETAPVEAALAQATPPEEVPSPS